MASSLPSVLLFLSIRFEGPGVSGYLQGVTRWKSSKNNPNILLQSTIEIHLQSTLEIQFMYKYTWNRFFCRWGKFNQKQSLWNSSVGKSNFIISLIPFHVKISRLTGNTNTNMGNTTQKHTQTHKNIHRHTRSQASNQTV